MSKVQGARAAHVAAEQVDQGALARDWEEGGALEVFAAAGQCIITGFQPSHCTRVHRSASRDTGSVTSLTGWPVYRVVMLGGPGVGKSAICSQFLSSDHVNTYESVGKRDVQLNFPFGSFTFPL